MGQKIDTIHHTKISSTNLWAVDHVDTFDQKTFYVISSDCQTGGIGQKDHSWHSPLGNLYVTYCFCNHTPLTPAQCTQALALSIAQVLHKKNIPAVIRWPNDLLVQDEKIGGILAQIHNGWTILGFGLNVNATKEDLKAIPTPTTSILLQTHQSSDLKSLLEEITEQFLHNYSMDYPSLKEALLPHLAYLLQKIEITTAKEVFIATLLGFSPDGFLLIQKEDGSTEKLISASIRKFF